MKRLTRAAQVRAFSLLRLRHFEFWPMSVFYAPLVPIYLLLGLKHRSLRAPLWSNPGLPNSGIIGESKAFILSRLPLNHPSLLKFSLVNTFAEARAFLRENALPFPIILKPDMGQRGSGVRLVRTMSELETEFARARVPLILQEYCELPEEVGVNYLRRPGEAQGRILGITRKRFPSVTGDGRRTVEELILADPRARLIARTYFRRHAKRLTDVLPSNISLRLVESGNHCQGAVFENGDGLRSPELESQLDTLARSVPEFYVGRFDLRFSSEAELRQGRFKLIELNGAAGEATHIYDRRNSLLGAYRVLGEQLNILFELGLDNRRRGLQPETFILKALRDYRRQSRYHPSAS